MSRRHHSLQAQSRARRADPCPAAEARKLSATPMFLCVDMEGGTVDRLRDVIAPVPSVAEVAASGSKEAFPQAWPPDRRRGARARLQYRFRARARSAISRIRNVLTTRTVSAQPEADGDLCARVSARPARLRHCRLRQALSRPGRGQTGLAPRAARDREALEAAVEGRPAALSRIVRPAAFRDGGARGLPAGDRRQHAGVAFEEVDERHPAQEDRLSRAHHHRRSRHGWRAGGSADRRRRGRDPARRG